MSTSPQQTTHPAGAAQGNGSAAQPQYWQRGRLVPDRAKDERTDDGVEFILKRKIFDRKGRDLDSPFRCQFPSHVRIRLRHHEARHRDAVRRGVGRPYAPLTLQSKHAVGQQPGAAAVHQHA